MSDLISREALREDLRRFFPTEVLEGIDPKTLFAQIMHDIDNAPEVELANHLRDRIKVIDHEITIPQSYEAKCFLDGKRKAFQYVLDLLKGGAEHE